MASLPSSGWRARHAIARCVIFFFLVPCVLTLVQQGSNTVVYRYTVSDKGGVKYKGKQLVRCLSTTRIRTRAGAPAYGVAGAWFVAKCGEIIASETVASWERFARSVMEACSRAKPRRMQFNRGTGKFSDAVINRMTSDKVESERLFALIGEHLYGTVGQDAPVFMREFVESVIFDQIGELETCWQPLHWDVAHHSFHRVLDGSLAPGTRTIIALDGPFTMLLPLRQIVADDVEPLFRDNVAASGLFVAVTIPMGYFVTFRLDQPHAGGPNYHARQHLVNCTRITSAFAANTWLISNLARVVHRQRSVEADPYAFKFQPRGSVNYAEEK